MTSGLGLYPDLQACFILLDYKQNATTMFILLLLFNRLYEFKWGKNLLNHGGHVSVWLSFAAFSKLIVTYLCSQQPYSALSLEEMEATQMFMSRWLYKQCG